MSNSATILSDLRKSIRVNSSISAAIYFDGTKLYDSVIKDVSTTGMRLYIPSIAWLPFYFELRSNRFIDVIPVKRIWLEGDDVGVQINLS